MKLFMLVSRVPWPLEKGDKLRAYNHLKELSKKHEVFLCCLSDRKVHPDALINLLKITPHVQIIQLNKLLIGVQLFIGLFSKKPFQVHYFFQRSVKKKVVQSIRKFGSQHIYCQLIRTSEYVKHLHEFKKTLDYMDALSAGQRRRADISSIWMKPLIKEEASRLAAYENLIFDYFDHHTIISEQDKNLIYHEQRNKIVIVPNGVDGEYFTPIDTEKKYDLVFTGNMNYPPNVDSAIRIAKEILPIIHKTHPYVNLLIAGANPNNQIIHLKSEYVHVSGWLNDIRTAYNQSRIFVAPMRIGSGLQNKILEAMSMNLPCITTSLAAKPMNATHDDNVLVGNTNEEIAMLIIQLLNNPEEAKKIAARGRQFVIDNFDWPRTVGILERLISSPQ